MNCRNGPCVSYSKSFLGREVPSARSGRALGAVSFGERVELFAGFEAHGFAGCDADLGASAGVAAIPVLRARTLKTPTRAVPMRSPAARASFSPSKTVSTAASALVRGSPVRSIT